MCLGVRWRDRSVRGKRKVEGGCRGNGVWDLCVYCRIEIPLPQHVLQVSCEGGRGW